MFLAFLIFDPKWLFSKVYSLCLEANFGYFQNALIFRVLGVFLEPLFEYNNSNVIVEPFFTCFWHF